MTSSLQEFKTALDSADFVFAVFYRGHWCPFCMSWLKQFAALTHEIESANGRAIAITAESESFLPKTLETTKFSGKVIIDDTSLVQEIKRRGYLDIAITKKSGYPNGMIQPAILVLDKTGKPIYSWAINPSLMNIGGATDRPALEEVWRDVQAALRSGGAVSQRGYTKMGFFTGIKQKMFG